jgi:hypothetical protein
MKKKSKNHKLAYSGLALAAIAGALYVYSSADDKQKKKVKGWLLKAKGEVLQKIENIKNIDKAEYLKIVDSVTKRYSKIKSINASELSSLKKELKKHWKKIQKELDK